jgi:superfamily I DNA and/or RNA helicase
LLQRKRGNVAVKTVDSFQGQEKDIIIFNCVRANPGNVIGFLSDVRRLNVAITRPRFFLFIVGHAETLRHAKNDKDQTWRKLIENCESMPNSFITI